MTLPTLPSSSAKAQAPTSEGCVTTPTCHSEPTLAPQSDDPQLTPIVAAPERDVEPQNQEDKTLAPPSEDLPIPSPSQTVYSMLEQMVDQWQKSAQLNSTLDKVCRKWDSMAGKWLPAILHCYDRIRNSEFGIRN